MNMLAEMLETSHKGKKKMMTDKLRVNNRIYKWILFAFLAESWVISMRGCAWNDSIIVYLMAAVIAAVVWSMELEKKISAGRMFKAAAVGSVAVCLFLTGALWGNIFLPSIR